MPTFLTALARAKLLALGWAVAQAAEPVVPLDLDLMPAAVAGVRVRELKPTSAVVEWPAPLGGDGRFRLETRSIFLDADQTLAQRWDELTGVPVAREGSVFTVRLTRLAPRQPHWLRVTPRNAAGAPGEPLFVVRLDTPAPREIMSPLRWTFGVLVFALAVLMWLRWRARR